MQEDDSSKKKTKNNKTPYEYQEDCELYADTYTFLMTAKYPFQGWYCDTNNKEQEDGENRAAGNGTLLAAENNINEEEIDATTTTFASTKLDMAEPDKHYLPFIAGSFVNFGQLFIYSVVLASIFFRGDLPSGADRLLRLAQVGDYCLCVLSF